MSNGTQINVITNTVEIRNVHNRIDIVAPNTGTNIAVTQPTTRVVQVSVPGPQGVQGQAGASADFTAINAFTGSIQTQVNSLTAATSSYILTSITSSMLQPYVLNASTGSFITNAQTASMTVLSSSFAVTASYINPTFISASAAASGFGSVPTETDPIFVARSASLATTGSNVFRGVQIISGSGENTILQVHGANAEPWAFGIYNDTYNPAQSVLAGFVDNTGEASIGTEVNKPLYIYTNANYVSPTLIISSSGVTIDNKLIVNNGITGSLEGTASWARNALTASSVGQLNQNVTILGNLQVFGTASYTYVSASQLDVGTNFISVNVAEPAQRFGGLRVYDSGSLSHQATASLAWDSTNNHWVYQNASGSTYSGGMLLSGPRNTGSLGDEPSLTRWRVARSDGGDHLNDTQIFSSASVHQITGSLLLSGSGLIISSSQFEMPNNIIVNPTTKRLNSGSLLSVDWGSRILHDNAQFDSVDWENKKLHDSTGRLSVAWDERQLKTFGGYNVNYNSDRVFISDTFLSDNIQGAILEDFATNSDGPWFAGHTVQGQTVGFTGLVGTFSGSTGWGNTRSDRPSEAGATLGIGINATTVLLQGDIVVNDDDNGIGFPVRPGSLTMVVGSKVYMSDYSTTGLTGMSLEIPTQNYVRELGYIYFAATQHQFIMRFNPSENWYLIS